jgi:ubiquitin-protein ligase
MSIIVENINKSPTLKETFINISHYNDYSYMEAPVLGNMKINFTNDYIYIYDMDNKNIIDILNMYMIKYNDINTLPKTYYSLIDKTNNKLSVIEDKMKLFKDFDEKTKYKFNKDKLYEKFKSCARQNMSGIPKELILNHNQVFNMIISEVEKINKNFNYNHYIAFNNDNPYELLFRLKYSGEIGEKLKIINKKFGFDYIELKVILDNSFYPFVPPKMFYNKPSMDKIIYSNIYNLEILKQHKWNSNISLEWLMLKIAEQFEKYFNQYININEKENNFSVMETLIFELYDTMNISYSEKLNIDIKYVNLSKQKDNKYWAQGTGYGVGRNNKWDINNFLKSQKDLNKEIINLIKNIKNNYNDIDDFSSEKNLMSKYFEIQFRGTTLLDFNKNIDVYSSYIDLISIMNLNINSEIISDLYEEIKNVLDTMDSIENKLKNVYCKFICNFEKHNKTNKEIIISDDIKEQYLSMVRKNIFGQYTFDNKHLYFKNKNDKIIDKKSLLRVISEISSLKKNVPVDWDTSVLVRIDKKQTNMIKFVITGPKDTPYHNGIFEFHAYFPSDYPNSPPQVLLNTTNGGKFRFNPNLYACGKVCLSLLGTWSGQEGETWNKEISTFLQVIVSIQSLIMVEEPYFNEPGWETSMNTSSGKKLSFEYKDNIRNGTMMISILNQLKSPPKDFEEFTKNHFKMKKDEIINTVEEWIKESKKYKSSLTELLDEFKELVK